MKTKKVILYVLMFLPLLITVFALPFLPEQIPAHFGFNNQVDRWGSKYEALITPVFTAFFGLFFLGISRFAARQEKDGQNSAKVTLTAGCVSLLIFDAMSVHLLYVAFQQVEDLSSLPIDTCQLVFLILGASLIVIGNLMPKLRMNSVMGLRTSWSMKNETVWKKSQRFGGISFMIVGALILGVSCFVKGPACAFWSLGILILALPVDVFYTYWAAKKG